MHPQNAINCASVASHHITAIISRLLRTSKVYAYIRAVRNFGRLKWKARINKIKTTHVDTKNTNFSGYADNTKLFEIRDLHSPCHHIKSLDILHEMPSKCLCRIFCKTWLILIKFAT